MAATRHGKEPFFLPLLQTRTLLSFHLSLSLKMDQQHLSREGKRGCRQLLVGVLATRFLHSLVTRHGLCAVRCRILSCKLKCTLRILLCLLWIVVARASGVGVWPMSAGAVTCSEGLSLDVFSQRVSLRHLKSI